MNRILEVCLIALTLVAGLTHAAAQPVGVSNRDSSFARTWKGIINGLPAIDLTLREADKKISGSIVFYFQERADLNTPLRNTAEHAVSLLKPQGDGRVLSFEVEHHVCHACPELGPNSRFRLELKARNEARLRRLEEDGTEAGPQLTLTRGNETPSQATPPVQAGISVKLPVTQNATAFPEADQTEALVVAVTGDGDLYLGTNPINLAALGAELRDSLSTRRGERKLFVKADARAPYVMVMEVVDAATAAGIEKIVLLTSQRESAPAGTMVSPKGFTVVTPGRQATAHPRLSL
jgi:biopolymer transport protein ExbD